MSESFPGTPDDSQRLLPLTQAQEGIWFAQRLSPDSSAYNLGEFLEILGPVDIGALERALRHFVATNDALKLRFVETPEGPRQYVGPMPKWRLAVVDFADATDPSTAARSWIGDDVARPFDLAQGPPFRYALLRVGPDRYFWYYAHHHICADGYSLWLTAQRVAYLYTALCRSGTDVLEHGGSWLKLHEGENAYLGSAQYRQDRNYWTQRLHDRPGVATLSGLPPARSIDSTQVTRTVSSATVQALRALAAKLETRLPQLVAVAAALYLRRLTGATDLVLGLVATGRDTGQVMRGTAGMVSKVLPLRVNVDLRDSLGDLVRHAAASLRELLNHQRYPSRDLRAGLGLRADETTSFGLTVNLFAFDYDLRFDGHAVRAHNVSPFPEEDFQIVAYDRRVEADMRIDFIGNRQRYAGPAIDAHGRRIIALLDRLAASTPQTPLGQLDILDTDERARLLHGFNATATWVERANVVEAFQSQIRRRPAATALVCDEFSLSYADLNARANQLAHLLISLGVGPEAAVGVCLDRSADLVATLLGILKAGGTYVPVDPSVPRSRAADIIESAAARHVVTSSSSGPPLRDRTDHPVGSSRGHRPARERADRRSLRRGSRRAASPDAPSLRHVHVRLVRQAQRGGHRPSGAREQDIDAQCVSGHNSQLALRGDHVDRFRPASRTDSVSPVRGRCLCRRARPDPKRTTPLHRLRRTSPHHGV